MTDYSNRPGGVLFPKDPAKKTNPNQPDFDGELIIDPAVMANLMDAWQKGQPIKLELAGWKKISAKGNPFMSLSAKLPTARPQRKPAPPPNAWDDAPDDEIPF